MSLKMLLKQVSLYAYPPFFAHPLKVGAINHQVTFLSLTLGNLSISMAR
jgi:hypothetical protein